LGLKLTVTREGAIRFEVRAKPRARRGAIVGSDGALLVQLAARPVDGAANEELVAILAGELDIPRRDATILRGQGARVKLVEVRGVSEQRVRARLERDATK
jgi:uncharacterized protein